MLRTDNNKKGLQNSHPYRNRIESTLPITNQTQGNVQQLEH